jgi:hypothetical protein
MIAVLTKWQKNATDSISWPNTTNFGTLYNETNLPPGFTLKEYTLFKSYLDDILGTEFTFFLPTDVTVEDASGNMINTRIFSDNEDYESYKGISDSVSAKRDELLLEFKLTRTVKVITDDAEITNVSAKINNYSELDAIIVA